VSDVFLDEMKIIEIGWP